MLSITTLVFVGLMTSGLIAFPDIGPIAFSIGPFPIRWYSLGYIVGILGGWLYARYLARRDSLNGIEPDDIDDIIGLIALGIIVGGRIGFVLFYNFSYYAANPAKIIAVWDGGMSFHGGMLGVLIATLYFCWRRKKKLLALADIICTAVPIGILLVRIANFINAELYGRVTDVAWAMKFPVRDATGTIIGYTEPRHPSQLYEAFLEGFVLLVVLFFIMHSRLRNRHGLAAGIFFLGYGLSRALVELVRQPDAQIGEGGFMLLGITMGQLLSLPMIILGAVLILIALGRKPVNASNAAKA